MKEIISAVILIVSLFAGTQVLKEIHDSLRRASLEKAATGLPSLTKMTNALQKKKEISRDVNK
jgi:hypothetical protein